MDAEQREIADGRIGHVTFGAFGSGGRRRVDRLSRVTGGFVTVAVDFGKGATKFGNASVQGTNAGIAVGVDLTQAFELSFGGDQLAGKIGGNVEHGLAFLLNVESAVLAGELSELVGSVVEVLLDDLETTFEENALAMSGGSGEAGNESVEFVDIGGGESLGALRATVGNTDGDDAALAIFKDGGAFIQLEAGIGKKLRAINFAQIELLDEVLLSGLAAQDANEERAGTFYAEKIAYTETQVATLRGHSSEHGHRRI